MRPFLLLSLLLLLSGCKEESLPAGVEVKGAAYFPLRIGSTWYYAVDSVTLRAEINGIRYDTVHFEAREQLLDSFVNAAGETWYSGERWERSDSTAGWRFTATFALQKDQRTANKTINNLSFTKLSFPASEGKRWDGHTAFDPFRPSAVGGEFLDVYAGWEYAYQSIGEAYTLPNGLIYPDVLVVQQAAIDNLIDRRIAYEVYAKEVGLIASFVDARHTQCRICCGGETANCIDLSWEAKAEKGFLLQQSLLRVE